MSSKFGTGWQFLENIFPYWSSLWISQWLEAGAGWWTEHFILEGQKLYPWQFDFVTRCGTDVTQSQNSWTPGQSWDIGCSWTTLLVAWAAHFCAELCEGLWHLPTVQDQQVSFSSILHAYSTFFIHLALCLVLDGPDYQPLSFLGIWLYFCHGGPWPYKGVILLPCNKTITVEQVAELLLEHLYLKFLMF